MKKSLIFAGLLTSIVVTAQYEKRVGINTDKPRASLEVKAVTVDGRTQGILFPHISDAEKKNWQPNDTTGLVAGTVIWNEDLKCLDYFDGEKWQCTDGSNPYYPPVNPTTDKTVKADVWDRTHYIGSFNHNGANIDGEIANTGSNALTLQIPYNQATTGKSYNEINITRTVQDRSGANKTLTLNIPAGTFSAAKGFLTATIKVGNGTTSDVYKVKQLPANTEETIATFVFSINGNVSNVKLIASGGVLDKKFNVQTNNRLEHRFIYLPVSVYTDTVNKLPDSGTHYEKKWLNNNLGANYANLDKTAVFNPVQQATSTSDYNAYGSLFQWQRPADGHELVNWTSSTTADLTPTTTTLWDNANWAPDHSKFIIGNSSSNYYSWVTSDINSNTAYHNLWEVGQINNPCPEGYYLPTYNEFRQMQLSTHYHYLNSKWYEGIILRIAGGMYRGTDGQPTFTEHGFLYWTAEARQGGSQAWGPNAVSAGIPGAYRSTANPVRCIAE